jgi:hypothetical protein
MGGHGRCTCFFTNWVGGSSGRFGAMRGVCGSFLEGFTPPLGSVPDARDPSIPL